MLVIALICGIANVATAQDGKLFLKPELSLGVYHNSGNTLAGIGTGVKAQVKLHNICYVQLRSTATTMAGEAGLNAMIIAKKSWQLSEVFGICYQMPYAALHTHSMHPIFGLNLGLGFHFAVESEIWMPLLIGMGEDTPYTSWAKEIGILYRF